MGNRAYLEEFSYLPYQKDPHNVDSACTSLLGSLDTYIVQKEFTAFEAQLTKLIFYNLNETGIKTHPLSKLSKQIRISEPSIISAHNASSVNSFQPDWCQICKRNLECFTRIMIVSFVHFSGRLWLITNYAKWPKHFLDT